MATAIAGGETRAIGGHIDRGHRAVVSVGVEAAAKGRQKVAVAGIGDPAPVRFIPRSQVVEEQSTLRRLLDLPLEIGGSVVGAALGVAAGASWLMAAAVHGAIVWGARQIARRLI